MKLQSRKSKNTKIAIIVAAALLVALVIGLIVYFIVDSQKSPIKEIIISVLPKDEYFVGDRFDSTGLRIQVIGNGNESSYMVDYTDPELQVSGFDSSAANDNVIVTVTYRGYSASFGVKVKEYPSATPVLESLRLSQDLSYSLGFWNRFGPMFDDINLVLVYSDGSEVEVPMKTSYCYEVDLSLESAGTTDFIIKYSDGVTLIEETITVTITN